MAHCERDLRAGDCRGSRSVSHPTAFATELTDSATDSADTLSALARCSPATATRKRKFEWAPKSLSFRRNKVRSASEIARAARADKRCCCCAKQHQLFALCFFTDGSKGSDGSVRSDSSDCLLFRWAHKFRTDHCNRINQRRPAPQLAVKSGPKLESRARVLEKSLDQREGRSPLSFGSRYRSRSAQYRRTARANTNNPKTIQCAASQESKSGATARQCLFWPIRSRRGTALTRPDAAQSREPEVCCLPAGG